MYVVYLQASIQQYQKMLYNKKDAISYGIRHKFLGKKQVFTIYKKGASKKALQIIADKVIKKLNKGLSEAEGKAYALAELDKL